jgi:hypothetical protein
MMLNHAAHYLGSSDVESCRRVTGKLCTSMCGVESWCRVSRQLFMILSHVEE